MTRPRLLLIEDDAALQILLFDVLGHAGYEVSVAMTDDYLYMAHEIQPAILVLGCDAHGRFDRGWDIAANLQHIVPRPTMILLSTNPDVVQEVGQTPRGMHFSCGLRKPFAINDLLRDIARCCQSAVLQIG